MSRIIASVEARMGSSRLPGKMLADINGRPALQCLFERLQKCKNLDGVILATTSSPSDDKIIEWAEKEKIQYLRGSEDDVLLRVVEAQRKMNSDIVVEVTGDCTMIDPELIDMGITTFLENDCDIVTNCVKPSFPMGEDIQVYRLSDLEEVERTISDTQVREHVSLYFYEHPERYRILNVFAPKRWHAPQYRFQLDYPEDLEFIRQIYQRLEPQFGNAFGIEEIMALLKQEPSLLNINIDCIKTVPRQNA